MGVEPLAGDWLDPAKRIHALDSMGHNWWMVCVGAAGLGAMGGLRTSHRPRDLGYRPPASLRIYLYEQLGWRRQRGLRTI